MCVGARSGRRTGGREKIYTRLPRTYNTHTVYTRSRDHTYTHTHSRARGVRYSRLAPLARESALAFWECHSLLPLLLLRLVALRFSVCPPFVRSAFLSGVQRALRLAGIPKFVRGRTFERSSVKKSATPLEKTALAYDAGFSPRFITLLPATGGYVVEGVCVSFLSETHRDKARVL